jgi:hypothetical protein
MKRIPISRSPLDWLGKDPQDEKALEATSTATVEPTTSPAPSNGMQVYEPVEEADSEKPAAAAPTAIEAPVPPVGKGSGAAIEPEVPPVTAVKKAASGARAKRPPKPEAAPQGLVRTTYHIYEENRLKVEEHAYWERMKIFEVVNRALQEYFERHPVSRK